MGGGIMVLRYIVKDYLQCNRCTLCNSRKNIVFGNGSIPTDLLFIGDVPSDSDDLTGKAFSGKQGAILQTVLNFALNLSGKKYLPRMFYTHLLICRPKVISKKGELEIVKKSSIEACTARLMQTIKDTTPRKIILLGDTVRQQLSKKLPDVLCVYHPNFILRKGGVECCEFRQMSREIATILERLDY